MHIRPMIHDDIPTCATIMSAGLMDDEFFAWLAPHRKEFPDAWRRFHLQRFRVRLNTAGVWGIVCVQKTNTADEEIIGFGLWSRQATHSYPFPPSKYFDNNKSVFAYLERGLLKIEEKYQGFVGNPAFSKAALKLISGGPPSISGFSTLPERWYLNNLVVVPEHQRKGIGQSLVNWGLERCREEKDLTDGKPLAAGLMASVQGFGLYKKMGFRVTSWAGEDMNMDGGAQMIWDPENTWVRPVEEKDIIALKGRKPVDAVYRDTADEAVVLETLEESQQQDAPHGAVKIVLPVDEEQEKANATAVAREIAT